MKRILYIGDLNVHARSYHIYQAMTELPYIVEGLSFVPIGVVPGVTQRPSLYYRVMHKLGMPLDVTNINGAIKHYINNKGCPDLIWLHKVPTLRVQTVKWLKQCCVDTPLIYYSNDNMLKKHNVTRFLRDYLPYVDIYYSIYRENLEAIQHELGVREVRIFHYGYNEHYFSDRALNTPYQWDVVFIGSFEQERFDIIRQLASAGVHVCVFGNGWHKIDAIKVPPTLKIERRPVYDNEFVHVLHQSRIALNFFRRANDDVITARAVEIPATGTFMLSERTDEVQKYFEEGKEAEYFDSPSELIEKVKYYLQHDEERERIARNGRKRCELSGYSYKERMKKVLEELTF